MRSVMKASSAEPLSGAAPPRWPFWDDLRRQDWARSALHGVNAAVVGLLLAALYNPVWTAGITSAGDFALAIAGFLLLFMWQTPPWLVVVLCAIGGGLIAAL
jgi:chromate transporter